LYQAHPPNAKPSWIEAYYCGTLLEFQPQASNTALVVEQGERHHAVLKGTRMADVKHSTFESRFQEYSKVVVARSLDVTW